MPVPSPIPEPTNTAPIQEPTNTAPIPAPVPGPIPVPASETMNLFKPANTMTEPVKPIPQTLSPEPAPITLSPEPEKEKKNSLFDTFNQFLNKKP